MISIKWGKSLFIELTIFCYVVLFLYAGGVKLVDHGSFVGQLIKSPILAAHATWVAWVVPIIELVVATTLLIPRFRLIALYASFGLMAAFTMYVAWILTFSDKLPCACGGILSSLHWKGHLVLNVSFLFLAATAIALYDRKLEANHSKPEVSLE